MRPPLDDLPRAGSGLAGISGGAIRHWRLLVLAAIGLLVVAWMAWRRIPRLEDPLIEPPDLFVTIPYPGAPAEEVESQVIKRIEDDLSGMDGVASIESVAYPNYAGITMRFDDGTPMESVVESVRGKILSKRKDLPPEVGDPIVFRGKTSTYVAAMVVVVSGNRSLGTLTDAAESLRDALAGVPGVAKVSLRGARRRAVRVRLDAARLAEHALTVEDVTARIRLSNVRVPAGEVAVGSLTTLLSVGHELEDAAGVARIPIAAGVDASGAGHAVTLGDVADIRDGARTQSERMIQDGIPAVGLELRFREGENAVQVGAGVRAALARARASLPQGVDIAIAHDQPQHVEDSLANLDESLASGVLLVMLVITLGMGWRSALVVAMVLPLSLAGAVFGLYAMGMALEQVSVAGLIVALGLLVDDAVVVTDSIQRMRDRGLSSVSAAVAGTARVFWANNATTAVACASFLPLFLMGGDVGSYIRGLPAAVTLALITSLLVAQLLTPWLSTLVMKRQAPALATSRDERNLGLRLLKRAYAWFVPRVVRHPLVVIGLATAMLGGACSLLPKVGVQFFPKADKPVVFVGVALPRGTSEDVTAHKIAQVEGELRKDPAVSSVSAVVGGSYPVVFLGHAPHAAGKDHGDILVRLSEPSTEAIASRLRARVASVPGAKITVDELYYGPAVEHPVVIRVRGDDYATLRRYADTIKTRLRGIAGTTNVADSMSDSIPVLDVDVDVDRAMRLGVSQGQVGAALRSVYGEDRVTRLKSARDDVEVVLEGPDPASSPAPALAPAILQSLLETRVQALGGRLVPLLAIGDVNITRGSGALRRRDGRRIVEVTADVAGGTLPSAVLAEITPQLDGMTWDSGYAYSFGGQQTETEKSFRNLGIAAVLTLLLVFVLLVLLFGSLTRALFVLAATPYVLIGALPGLYLTHNPFGFMAFLGLVGLLGVYVNHKIYFAERVHQLVGRGTEWKDAIARAGIDRMRPVVLTALTAILGLLPLTLRGGVFWSAFGWISIFGLAASIPLSLVLLPALLALSYRVRGARPSAAVRPRPEETPAMALVDADSTVRMAAAGGQVRVRERTRALVAITGGRADEILRRTAGGRKR